MIENSTKPKLGADLARTIGTSKSSLGAQFTYWMMLRGQASWVPGEHELELQVINKHKHRLRIPQQVLEWCQETQCGQAAGHWTLRFQSPQQITLFRLRWS